MTAPCLVELSSEEKAQKRVAQLNDAGQAIVAQIRTAVADILEIGSVT
jgi:hypothetical protein